MRRHLVHPLQLFEGGVDSVVEDLLGAALGDASGGERGIVAQDAVRLVAVVACHTVPVDGEHRRDPEGQHQQCRYHANLHGPKNLPV